MNLAQGVSYDTMHSPMISRKSTPLILNLNFGTPTIYKLNFENKKNLFFCFLYTYTNNQVIYRKLLILSPKLHVNHSV